MSSSGIYPALSGAVVQNNAMELISSNLANSSTVGFRGQKQSFKEALARRIGKQIVNFSEQRFVQVGATQYDMSQGNLKATGVSTDLALSGPGFLTVQTPQGERFVRGGSLTRTMDGRLTNSAGNELVGIDNKPIRIGRAGELGFGPKGEVILDKQQIGQLKVVEFKRPQDLRGEGGGLFVPAAGDPALPAQKTEVLAQHLENANVNPVKLMTDMIVTSRHYEALHRLIETYREMDTSAARELATIS